MEIENHTPWAATWIPITNIQGLESILIVVKGTYSYTPQGKLALAETPRALQAVDVLRGEPGKSSVLWESDMALAKEGTDVILLGQARGSSQTPGVADVTLQVGPIQKTLRVLGDRRWEKGPLGLRPSKPSPFETIPLIFERAFGGGDPATMASWLPENPVGIGYRADPRQLENVPLPNLEDPRALIQKPGDKPMPMGVGFVGRSWAPRCRLAGTYDTAWRESRAPLLPGDFQIRHFNAAPADQIAPTPLQGGEPIFLGNVGAVPQLRLTVPRVRLLVKIVLGGDMVERILVLDTLVLDTEASQLVLLWRTSVPCHRRLLRLRGLRLDALEGPQ